MLLLLSASPAPGAAYPYLNAARLCRSGSADPGGSDPPAHRRWQLTTLLSRGSPSQEAMHINKSLSALGDVISSLTSKRSHTPFRNSKLTHILSDSLGNDSKTLLLVACSPAQSNAHESSCSLNFAQRARNVDLGQGAGESRAQHHCDGLYCRAEPRRLPMQGARPSNASRKQVPWPARSTGLRSASWKRSWPAHRRLRPRRRRKVRGVGATTRRMPPLSLQS